eukprot:CAMPEP_0184551396 /NCGR_PEP_ID=MMETSP0199_2-20130426/24892_1 /TAXON_ID=1112570 /ORGANISM="Thraustochytrium sp., Strain LLF1b" /LENGTH=287 /DNA_ID=CAMNT_0026946553 /DNA_START=59 /DNA_END=922 /DNA_ORIENTATION=-
MIDLFSGTTGGLAQVAVGHPLDTVKVMLQTQKPDANGKVRYAGMMDCFKQTLASDGFKGLYRGAASPLIGAMLHNAALFFSFGKAKHLFGADEPNAPLHSFFLSGALAGGFVVSIEAPMDFLKITVQTDSTGQYKGVMDAARKVYNVRGIAGIYQGGFATAVRNIPCFGFYFLGSEIGSRAVNPPGEPTTPASMFLGGLAGGALAGFLFWGILYPLETVKSRLQGDHIIKEQRVYKSYMDCVRQTWNEGGVKTFYKGYTPAITRAVPVNAVIFSAVYNVKNFLQQTV